MKDIAIIGAGGFGREVAWLIEEINKDIPTWNILGFIDDSEDIQGSQINGYEVIGTLSWLMDKEVNVVNTIANPIAREQVTNTLKNTKNIYPNIIHPSVLYSDSVEFGIGNIICAGTILTVNIYVNNFVIINLDCTIGHDAVVKDFATILPSVNVSGNTLISKGCSIGTGTAIIQGLTIGENTIIGAGSTVIKNIQANCTAVGSPAKVIKIHI